MPTYEVILSQTTDTVYRVEASTDELAVETAQEKCRNGEQSLHENTQANPSRVRLIPREPIAVPVPTKRRKRFDYLTSDEAADELRMTKFTVNKYIKTGVLKANKVGRQWRIPRTEVERLLRGE